MNESNVVGCPYCNEEQMEGEIERLSAENSRMKLALTSLMAYAGNNMAPSSDDGRIVRQYIREALDPVSEEQK